MVHGNGIIKRIKRWWLRPWPVYRPMWVGETDDEEILKVCDDCYDVLIIVKDRRPWRSWLGVVTNYEWHEDGGISVGPVRLRFKGDELYPTFDVNEEEEAYLRRIFENAPQVYRDRVAHIEDLLSAVNADKPKHPSAGSSQMNAV